MLSDFFRINLPYGIARNEAGEWVAFNREYLPLGFNKTLVNPGFDINGKSDYPIHTKYRNIKEQTLLKLADQESAISRDEAGKVQTVFLYDDRTNPMNDNKFWDHYIEKLKIVSKFKADN